MIKKLKLALTTFLLTLFQRRYLLLAAICFSVAGALGVPFCGILAGLAWLI